MSKKCILKIIILIIVVLLLFMWGYWEYLGYKFDKNPLYYYKPRTIEHARP